MNEKIGEKKKLGAVLSVTVIRYLGVEVLFVGFIYMERILISTLT